jgi:hypothetical protein
MLNIRISQYRTCWSRKKDIKAHNRVLPSAKKKGEKRDINMRFPKSRPSPEGQSARWWRHDESIRRERNHKTSVEEEILITINTR